MRSNVAAHENLFVAKWKTPDDGHRKGQVARTPSHRSAGTTDSRSLVVSLKTRRSNPGPLPHGFPDEEVEMIDSSHSDSSCRAATAVQIPADESLDRSHSERRHSQWRDSQWDDVVITIDATLLAEDYYPIPMTTLKPGSRRAACRWDDFELDDLFARFKVESGFEIDNKKHLMVWSANDTSMVINTPGKYKLMLKEFAERTQRSSTMVLYLRVVERASLNRTSVRNERHRNFVYDRAGAAVKRSQFTGAASDYSSDSDSGPAPAPLKRWKSDIHSEGTTASSDAIAAYDNIPSDHVVEGDGQEMSMPQVRSDISKMPNLAEELSQDSS